MNLKGKCQTVPYFLYSVIKMEDNWPNPVSTCCNGEENIEQIMFKRHQSGSWIDLSFGVIYEQSLGINYATQLVSGLFKCFGGYFTQFLIKSLES